MRLTRAEILERAARPPRKPRGDAGGKTTYAKPRWRYRELLAALGTEQEVSDQLVMRGYPRVPPSSITGWLWRNSIPVVWLPVILQMGREAAVYEQVEDLRIL